MCVCSLARASSVEIATLARGSVRSRARGIQSPPRSVASVGVPSSRSTSRGCFGPASAHGGRTVRFLRSVSQQKSVSQSVMSAGDLIEHVDLRGVECLNAERDDMWRHAVCVGERDQETLTLVTDDDEELILTLPFTSNVKPTRAVIKGGSTRGNEETSAPMRVKIFVNPTALSFQNIGKKTAAQVIECSSEDGAYDLDATAFDNVRTLTFYVESNAGGTDKTEISRIEIHGCLADSANMNDLKPC